MINKVFLDVDDVLADFSKAVCNKFDLSYPPKTYHFFESIRPQVNNICTIDFWEHLEWTPDGKEILKLVEHYFNKKNIYLLTCPMSNEGSWTGKYLWVRRKLPNYVERLIITQTSKENLADKSTLLIDDCEERVERFLNKGYEAVLVPRLWNSLRDIKDSVEQVKEQLEFIVNQEH